MAPATAASLPFFAFATERIGPIRAVEFESWPLEEDNPLELIAGWVVPMSPGRFRTGELLGELAELLRGLSRRRGWRLSLDARHRLPHPFDTVVFPDIALHCAQDVLVAPGTDTALRVPDLVIEILSAETAARDQAPHGAKFAAYEASGVAEYFYAWPDGTGAAAHHLEAGRFVSRPADEEGFFPSEVLGAKLRLVPPGLVG